MIFFQLENAVLYVEVDLSAAREMVALDDTFRFTEQAQRFLVDLLAGRDGSGIVLRQVGALVQLREENFELGQLHRRLAERRLELVLD